MHVQTFVAFHSQRSVNSRAVARRIFALESYYKGLKQDIGPMHGLHQNHVGAFCWAPVSPHTKIKLLNQHRDSFSGSLHWPFGITRFASTEISRDMDVDALSRLIERDPAAMTLLAPPQVVFRVSQDGLFIANDELGFGHIYSATHKGLTVWSNRIGALLMFLGHVPEIDNDAWRTFMNVGWFLGEQSPFLGVRVAPPASRFSAPNDSNPPVNGGSPDKAAKGLAASLSDCSISPLDVATGLQRTFLEIGRFTSAQFNLGLSGGRDSRLVAAGALSTGANAKITTHYPPLYEKELAERLLASFPNANWKANNRRARVSNYTEDMERPRFTPDQIRALIADADDDSESAIVQKAMAYAAVFDGDKGPNKLYSSPSAIGPYNTLSLSGASGEFAHPNYYTPAALQGDGNAFAQARLAALATNKSSLPETQEAAKAAVFDVAGQSSALGIDGLRRLDHFYVFGRFRRWADGSKNLNMLLPLLTPEYITAGFAEPVERRFESVFQREVIAHLVPEWEGIPFGHEIDLRPKAERPSTDNHPYFWETDDLFGVFSVLKRQDIWGHFFKESIIDEFASMFSMPTAKRSRLQTMAFRMSWLVGFNHHVHRMRRHLTRYEVSPIGWASASMIAARSRVLPKIYPPAPADGSVFVPQTSQAAVS